MVHQIYTFKATNYENTYVTVSWNDVIDAFVVGYIGPPEASDFTSDIPAGELLPYNFCRNTTLHAFKTKKGFPYAEHVVTFDATECTLPKCTLAVRTPIQTKKASDINTPDGEALIEYDGYGINVQYSLDNTTWQDSNSFTGLAPGSYTIYVVSRDPSRPEADYCRNVSPIKENTSPKAC